MSSPKYKLTYFPFRGQGEPVRYMFAAAGVPYEDNRINLLEWMTTLKAEMPFGQVPVLECGDGRLYAQCRSICRYLGTRFNLVASSDEDRMQADMVGDCMGDMASHFWRIRVAEIKERNFELAKELGKTFESQIVPPMMANFEKMLVQNGGGDGYFVGDKLTWVDIYVAAMLEGLEDYSEHFKFFKFRLDDHPKMKAHCDRVLADKGIAEWRQTRPATEF